MKKIMLSIFMFCLTASAQEPAKHQPPFESFSETLIEMKSKELWLQQWNAKPSLLLASGASFSFSAEPAPIIWLTIKQDETRVGWLIPACTKENLKRAPKLTAWVVEMQRYQSPQARWLTALFKACDAETQ